MTNNEYEIVCVPEIQLDEVAKTQIAKLLTACFPEEDFQGRHYFKQLPHHRLLLKVHGQIIAQLALDYRMMTLNQNPIRVLGLIDLAVLPQYEKQGYARKLLEHVEKIFSDVFLNIDFMLLSTEKFELYQKFGFKCTRQKVKWLAMDNHQNYGVKEEWIDDCLMYKSLSQKAWVDGANLDFLGYWY